MNKINQLQSLLADYIELTKNNPEPIHDKVVLKLESMIQDLEDHEKRNTMCAFCNTPWKIDSEPPFHFIAQCDC